MKKYFYLILVLFLSAISTKTYAQLPEVSTAENPKWYYMQVQGSVADRRDRVLTNESNKIYGREIVQSLSYTDLNKQLWRFEQSEDGNYIVINKTANRKLDITFESSTSIVKVMLKSGTPSTNWKFVAKGDYYSIQAVTALEEKPTSKYVYINDTKNNYDVIAQSSAWQNSKDAFFKFVKFDDPNLIMSDDESQTWYVIKSNRPGYEGKCVTDVVSSALPNIKFGIDDFKEGDYSQQWKLIKKTTVATDKRFELVNRATGNIIQTTYSQKGGYYYTESTTDMNKSNGWLIGYFGDKEYEVYGVDGEGVNRYLNATLAGEVPAIYQSSSVKGTGFSWTFEKVGPSTGWDYIAQPGDWDGIIVYSEEGFIKVKGADDYMVRTITGVVVDKNTSLPTGVYLVTVNGKTKVVVNQ